MNVYNFFECEICNGKKELTSTSTKKLPFNTTQINNHYFCRKCYYSNAIPRKKSKHKSVTYFIRHDIPDAPNIYKRFKIWAAWIYNITYASIFHMKRY